MAFIRRQKNEANEEKLKKTEESAQNQLDFDAQPESYEAAQTISSDEEDYSSQE